MAERLLDTVDLFAGPGGWDVAARGLGLSGVGIELDASTCETREAAGLATVEGDVRHYRPADLPAAGLIASPPCQTFSQAGRGSGRAALDLVLGCVTAMASGTGLSQLARAGTFTDERTGLVLEPLRWALEAADTGQPYRWVALEQVPSVLPVWQAMAAVLATRGYGTAVGYVNAEQHGVPQTRKRAVLMARLGDEARLPVPTHSRFYMREPARLDEGVAPWVSMAQALGWGASELVGFPRQGDQWDEGVTIGGTTYRARDLRSADNPAFVVTSKARSWQRYLAAVAAEVEPRVNNQSGTEFDLAWPAYRPAPTIAGRHLVTMPGENANRFNPAATKSRNDGIRVQAWEAGVLQTFPPDYPWRGTRTRIFGQIGNAIPPLMAAAVLAEVAQGEIMAICQECGNDLVCEGYPYCSECLETLGGAA